MDGLYNFSSQSCSFFPLLFLFQTSGLLKQKKERLEEDWKALQDANQALQKEKLALEAKIAILQQTAKVTVPVEEFRIKMKVRFGGSSRRLSV